jgi:hypothetical protein
LVASGWFVLRENYYWLVADKPNKQSSAARYYRTVQQGIVASAAKSSISKFSFVPIDLMYSAFIRIHMQV